MICRKSMEIFRDILLAVLLYWNRRLTKRVFLVFDVTAMKYD